MGRLTYYNERGFAYVNHENCANGYNDLIDKLAHYEDMEDQGRLIELPCAVGTPIWLITWDYDEFNDRCYYATPTTFALEDVVDLGTAIFLTKEEAEAKLEELKNEHV